MAVLEVEVGIALAKRMLEAHIDLAIARHRMETTVAAERGEKARTIRRRDRSAVTSRPTRATMTSMADVQW
jgi:hypothetical protein